MGKTTLQLKNVSKAFGDHIAVDNVSIRLNQGEIYGFLGPNGAGKTTAIRMIMDFIRPTSGEVKLFGHKHGPKSSDLLEDVGFLSADSQLYSRWNSKKHIDFVESIRSSETIDKNNLISKLGLNLSTTYQKLSSGNKQKLALTLAIMNRPKLLVLDEPTRGLDPLLQQEIYALLQDFKKAGGSVFMSSHNLSEVQKICDRVGIIKDGKLVASETLDTLRKKNIHQISIQFVKSVDINNFQFKDVEIIKHQDKDLIVNVHGDLNIFLKNLTNYNIIDIEITHLSLEELFLRYYK